MNRIGIFAAGIVATLAVTALWHGPLGAADRLAARVEASARAQLDRDEMTQVQARLQRGPLTRRLLLSGPADSYQRAELARRMGLLRGIDAVRWDAASLPGEARR